MGTDRNIIKPNRAGISTVLLAALFLAGLFPSGAARASSPEKEQAMVGKPAPRFSASDLDGNRRVLDEILKTAKAVVVNFWGLRCAPCIQEMPHIDAISKKFASKGLFVFGVNVDGVDAATIKTKLKQMSLAPSYCILPDPEMGLVDLFKMSTAPLTLILDSKGIVRFQHVGFEEGDEEALEKAIVAILGAAN